MGHRANITQIFTATLLTIIMITVRQYKYISNIVLVQSHTNSKVQMGPFSPTDPPSSSNVPSKGILESADKKHIVVNKNISSHLLPNIENSLSKKVILANENISFQLFPNFDNSSEREENTKKVGINTITESTIKRNMTPHERKEMFRKSLMENASNDKVIMLALIDHGYLDVALNFYETSILKHNIHNFLFVSMVQSACDNISDSNVNCVAYYDLNQGEKSSNYMSPEFLHKMALRTQFITDALEWGYTIIHTDIDIIFFKDPIPYLLDNNNYHIQGLQDLPNYLNAGFLCIRSTEATVQIYQKLTSDLLTNPQVEDQSQLNQLVNKVKAMDKTLNIRYLDMSMFLNGVPYFEGDGYR